MAFDSNNTIDNAGITKIGIAQRGSLKFLEQALREYWNLGQNNVLCWSINSSGISVLMVPHYFLAQFSSSLENTATKDRLDALNGRFVRKLIAGKRQMDEVEFTGTAKRFDIEPTQIDLPVPVGKDQLVLQAIESMVRRHSISYVSKRAVLLFDIVDFALFSPFEQTSQLSSLSYSLNAAFSKMLAHNINIDFARTTTGDGFYIWNRNLDAMADTHLFQFMLMVMANNAVAQSKAVGRTVPTIRTGFHVGSHYEFYQAQGVNPTMFSYIVGDVTIELARIVESAAPGQIYIGDFTTNMPTSSRDSAFLIEVDSGRFVERARKHLASLKGVELSGGGIESIHCFLTGETSVAGGESIHRFKITDKHGLSRNAYNLRVNIQTTQGRPILLGSNTLSNAADRVTGGTMRTSREK
jgi:class 3 adenylate cyclase